MYTCLRISKSIGAMSNFDETGTCLSQQRQSTFHDGYPSPVLTFNHVESSTDVTNVTLKSTNQQLILSVDELFHSSTLRKKYLHHVPPLFMVEISHFTADSFAAMAWSAGPLPRDACSSSTRSFPTAPRSCLSGARHGVRSRALPRISCDLAIFRWEFGWRFQGFNGAFGLGFPRGVLCSMGFRTGFYIFYGNLGNLRGSSMVVWGFGWESSTLPTCKNKKRWPKIAFPVLASLRMAVLQQFSHIFTRPHFASPHFHDMILQCTRSTRQNEVAPHSAEAASLAADDERRRVGDERGRLCQKSARVEASITSGRMSTPDE